MDVTIRCLPEPKSAWPMDRLQSLAEKVFFGIEPSYINWRIHNMPYVSLFIASIGDEWVGFKCGYAMTRRRYYSWLGGVDPQHRSSGIAAQLMQAQHDWVRASDYPVVETHVRQGNLAMIRANQKFDYKIVGRFLKGDEVNLIMQRQLDR